MKNFQLKNSSRMMLMKAEKIHSQECFKTRFNYNFLEFVFHVHFHNPILVEIISLNSYFYAVFTSKFLICEILFFYRKIQEKKLIKDFLIYFHFFSVKKKR